ncbi:MAG: histidine kinase N-terminal 7TM domain-containing protein [bacterium]
MYLALFGFISFALNFIFGILVYSYNSKDIANKTFRNLVLAISLWCFGVGMGYISVNVEIAFKWAIFRAITAFLIAPCFVHFCFALSRKYNLLNQFILFLIYLPCLISIPMILIEPGVLIKNISINPFGGYEKEFNTLYQIHGLYLASCVIIGLYTIIKVRLQNKLLQTSIFIGFILGCTSCLIIYFILYPVFNINLLYIGPLFTLAFLCSIAYALIQPEGLMNVRVREILGEFLVKSISYILLILTSVIIFVSVLYFTKWMWIPGFESNIWVYLPGLGLAVFVSTHFKPGAYTFAYKLIYGARRFLWRKRFLALSLNLKRDCPNEEVIKLIREQIPKIINTNIYHLLFYNQENDTFKIIDSNKDEVKDTELQLSMEDALIQRINIGNGLKVISEIESDASFEKGISIFKRYKVELCLPIKQKKELLGIICFGKRNLFPHYDLEQKKEISRLIYLDALPFIQGYLESKFRNLPYIISIYIRDIPDKVFETKDEHFFEYLLNPDKVRIKIVKDGNKVLTEDLELIPPEKIIFNYLVYTAYINAVFDKYSQWDTIPSSKRIFSKELADSQGWVANALNAHHGYVPVESRIRQWIGNIRYVLSKMDAADLIPRETTSRRGRGKGYTINGKIILLKETVSKL